MSPNVCGNCLDCLKRLEMGYISIQNAKKMKIFILEGSLYVCVCGNRSGYI